MFPFKKKTNFSAIKSILIDHLKQLEHKKELIPDDVFEVTKFSIEEFISTFESMDTLMQKQDFEGCIKLSRSILENSINLRYIYKEDTENRAKNFKLASIKKPSDRFEGLDEVTPEAKEMYNVFQDMLKDYQPEKNIRTKFQSVNSDSVYIRSYKRLSEYIHPVYRPERINFKEDRPYVLEMKRTVRSDTCLITLKALEAVCTKYDLDGEMMIIDEPGYIGKVFFSTNPKKAEVDIREP